MKKMFFSLLLGICTATTFAGTTPEVSIVDAGKKSFVLYIDEARSGFVHVTLKDANGVILLTDRVKNEESFARKYNLINLPAGEYVLFVEDGPRMVAQSLSIDHRNLVIVETQTKLFAPSIQVNHQKLDFTMLCLDPIPVTIEIYDEAGRTNYTATTVEKGSVQRRFDISALAPGKYTVVTKVEGEKFRKVYRDVFTIGADIAGN